MITAITALSLEHQLNITTKPVLVDVWAAWCGPCKKLSPIIEKLSNEEALAGVDFYKLDADGDREFLEGYSIRSIPTMLLFKDGVEIGRMIGAAGPDVIRLWMTDMIAVH